MTVRASQLRRAPFGTEAGRRLLTIERSEVERGVEALLASLVNDAWQGGWQPSELHRQGRLGCTSASAGRLVAWAIANDQANRRANTMDYRWIAQLADLDLPTVNGHTGWVREWSNSEGIEQTGWLPSAIDALANLSQLPRLERVLPPPGDTATQERTDEPEGGSTDPLLQRIRNLLAKAESTTFEAEATALTAKAQELMTRHAIDSVLIDRGERTKQRPVIVRVPVDPPYVDAKSLLLQVVAEAGRCRTMMLTGLAMSTVVGFPEDVAGVEMLFTSLLVQAQAAVAEAARHAPPGTRTRSQSYRSSFLLSYSQRVGDRLTQINDAVYAEAEAQSGASFLPILRSREAELDDYMSKQFGDLIRSPVRGGRDAAGWASGRVAADNARLNSGDIAHADTDTNVADAAIGPGLPKPTG